MRQMIFRMMLSSMLDTAIELMGFDAGAISLVNEAEHVLELQYQQGYPPELVEGIHRVPLTLPRPCTCLPRRVALHGGVSRGAAGG